MIQREEDRFAGGSLRERKRSLLRKLVAKSKEEKSQLYDANNSAPFSPADPARISRLNLSANDVLIDLGCGDGRWLIEAAKRFGCSCLGYEIDGELVCMARKKAEEAGVDALVKVHLQDIYEADIRSATVVIVYIFPKMLESIKGLLMEQLSPTAKVISLGFRIKEWSPNWICRGSSGESMPVYGYSIQRQSIGRDADGKGLR